MKLLGKDWSYINEGNAHIVLQIKDTEFVLRVIKEDSKSVDLENVQNSVNFVNFILNPLLSNDSKCAQEVKSIPPEELQELREALHTIRPENRKVKSVLSKYAIQTLNLTLLSPKCGTYYCIEIKPKEGFLSSGLKPLSKCYYCLKQYLKLEMGEVQVKSSYCPLDLFSGNKERMRQALMSLIDNPQNNLKIFENGQVIYHATSTRNDFDEIIQRMGIFHSIMQYLDFIIEILLKDIEGDYTFGEMFKRAESYPLKLKGNCIHRTDINEYKFRKSCLHKLLQLQKLSEGIDLKVIEDEGTEYVETIIHEIKSLNLNFTDDRHRERFLTTLDPLHASLISAVAKDCSIMICFTPNFMEELPFIKLGKKKISYRVAVTDLEPKPVKSLVKRKETESRLIDIYNCKLAMK